MSKTPQNCCSQKPQCFPRSQPPCDYCFSNGEKVMARFGQTAWIFYLLILQLLNAQWLCKSFVQYQSTSTPAQSFHHHAWELRAVHDPCHHHWFWHVPLQPLLWQFTVAAQHGQPAFREDSAISCRSSLRLGFPTSTTSENHRHDRSEVQACLHHHRT